MSIPPVGSISGEVSVRKSAKNSKCCDQSKIREASTVAFLPTAGIFWDLEGV
jgi:hypothetical protein